MKYSAYVGRAHASNLSNDEVRKVQGEWLPKISAFFNQIQLDPRLFQKTKQVYDNLGTSGLERPAEAAGHPAI